jgi:hypothetical protein
MTLCFTFPTDFWYDEDACGGACDSNLDDIIIDTTRLLNLLTRHREKRGWETNHRISSSSMRSL